MRRRRIPPREVRRAILRDALSIYQRQVGIGVYRGICSAIADALEPTDYRGMRAYEVIPELYLYKPKGRYLEDFWFRPRDVTSRLRIFHEILMIYDNDSLAYRVRIWLRILRKRMVCI